MFSNPFFTVRFNNSLPGGGRGLKWPPLVHFVTSGTFWPNLSGIYCRLFFKDSNRSLLRQHLFTTRYILYAFYWNNEYILWIYSTDCAFKSSGFRNVYIHFSNNTFPIDTVITSLGNYMWVMRFLHKSISMTVLKYDDTIKKVTSP